MKKSLLLLLSIFFIITFHTSPVRAQASGWVPLVDGKIPANALKDPQGKVICAEFSPNTYFRKGVLTQDTPPACKTATGTLTSQFAVFIPKMTEQNIYLPESVSIEVLHLEVPDPECKMQADQNFAIKILQDGKEISSLSRSCQGRQKTFLSFPSNKTKFTDTDQLILGTEKISYKDLMNGSGANKDFQKAKGKIQRTKIMQLIINQDIPVSEQKDIKFRIFDKDGDYIRSY